MKQNKTFRKCGSAKRWLLLTMLAILGFGQGAWATDRSLEGNATDGYYINMPKTGTDNLTIPSGVTSFKVYDDGGSTGNYSKNCDGTLVLTAPAGYALVLSGTVYTESGGYDYLQVYNGGSTSAQQLGKFSSMYSGANEFITTPCQSSGTKMTLYFKSNASMQFAGLNLTVALVKITPNKIAISNTTGGSVSATVGGTSATTATVDQTVTLTATPKSGYLLSGITVKDANNNPVLVTGGDFINNTATFTMPPSEVTVTPTFTTAKTADGGLYINMPKTGTVSGTIPSGVTSFKVYDDGGSTGDYSDNCDGTLVLTAPTGYALVLTGTVTTETAIDYLRVHDGNSTSATQLGKFYSSSNNATTSITPCISSGTAMTLYFKSTDCSNYDGLDLTVMVINPSIAYDITINSTTGGSVVASVNNSSSTKTTAGQTVTLTATPENGYLLSGITVKDANNNPVLVTGGDFINNTATFTMPASAVTVTPTFTNTLTADCGLSINMPATGSKEVTIPSGVTSFKVYDDGGSTGNYSNSCDGTLVLTAPTGYVLQVSGTVTTEDAYDELWVHDGSSTSETQKGKFISSTSGTPTNITTCTSSGTAMTLYFRSDGGGNYAGLNLTVTLISAADLAYAAISGISDSYLLTGENIKPEPIVTDAMHNVLTKGTDYTLTWSGDGTTAGTYTVTATGTGDYTGSISKEYIVKDYDLVISSKDDWNTFASNVGNGTTYSGEYVKLTADISVSTMVGTSSNPFQGSFDGNGHTLTVTYDDVTEEYAAPFRCVNAATIQNLKVAGTISTSNKFAASIIGRGEGAYKIQNSEGNVAITSTVSGDGTHGGLVGVSSGSGIITDCAFTGSISGENTNSCGGIIGWSNAAATLTNVLQAGTFSIGTSGCNTISRGTASSCNNVYYLNAIGDTQVKGVARVYTSTSDVPCYSTFGAKSVTAADGNTYYVSNLPAGMYVDGSGNLAINMPTTDTTTLTLSDANITSFKVYDDGGSTGKYSDNCRGTLTLTAPAGYVLQVSGSVTTEKGYDYLMVYDGSSTSDTQLGKFSSSSEGTTTAIDTCQSSDTAMTLYFKSDGGYNYAGLDLTVTLVPVSYNVTLNTNEGTINSGNVTSYTYGTGATLPTDITREGYTFDGWYAASDFSGSAVTEIGTTETGDKTFYAKWTSIADIAVSPAAEMTIDGLDGYGYWATLYTDINRTIPEGVRTFYIGSINSETNNVLLTEVTDGILTGGNGYMIASTTSEAKTFEYSAEAPANVINPANNLLKGSSVTGTTVSEANCKYYVLTTDKLGANVAFYYQQGQTDGTAVVTQAGKAYLRVESNGANARAFKLKCIGDETTGIGAIDNGHELLSESEKWTMDNEGCTVYTLQGIRIEPSAMQKGTIYIVNGRKVMIKK